MKQWAKEVIMLVTGCFCYVLSTVLINPVEIVPGSVLGISVVAYALWGISIGTVNIVCNVPIMIFCTMRFGKKILFYTILIIISTSTLIDLCLPHFPVILADYGWLLAIIGGCLMGIGAGLLMRAGGTMGGTTAMGRILQKTYPKLNMGVALFVMDTAIIIVGAVLLKSFTGLLYSILYTFICTKVIDMIYSYNGAIRIRSYENQEG